MGEEAELHRRRPQSRRPKNQSAIAGDAGNPDKPHGVGNADYFPPSFAKEKVESTHTIVADDVDEARRSAADDAEAIVTITGDNLEKTKEPSTLSSADAGDSKGKATFIEET
jgi:hypothetical protein